MTSIVLATDVTGLLTSRALAKAGQWLCPTLLISVELMLVLLWLTTPGFDIRWVTLWLIVIGAGVVTALRADRVWVGIVSMVVASGGGSYFYAISLAAQLGDGATSDNLLLSLPKIAAVVAGVGGRSLRSCIALSTIGFGLTGATSIIAARHTSMIVGIDLPAIAAYVAVVGLLIVLWKARESAGKGASDMNLAGFEEEDLREEARILSYASSVLHDTVLNDLQALALSPPGALSDAQQKLIERDLELLSGSRELLITPLSSALAEQQSRDAEASPLAPVIARSQTRGVRVALSGDPAALARLPAPAERAVVMAIDQCLVNVSQHSGVNEVEMAVVGTPVEVTVLITDAGRGFDTGNTGPERLGLRLSVHDRIRSIGGSVRIWSSPGSGTAILLAVAIAPATEETQSETT